jgi:hypothetical protein
MTRPRRVGNVFPRHSDALARPDRTRGPPVGQRIIASTGTTSRSLQPGLLVPAEFGDKLAKSAADCGSCNGAPAHHVRSAIRFPPFPPRSTLEKPGRSGAGRSDYSRQCRAGSTGGHSTFQNAPRFKSSISDVFTSLHAGVNQLDVRSGRSPFTSSPVPSSPPSSDRRRRWDRPAPSHHRRLQGSSACSPAVRVPDVLRCRCRLGAARTWTSPA